MKGLENDNYVNCVNFLSLFAQEFDGLLVFF